MFVKAQLRWARLPMNWKVLLGGQAIITTFIMANRMGVLPSLSDSKNTKGDKAAMMERDQRLASPKQE
jgi:hypothetical protein